MSGETRDRTKGDGPGQGADPVMQAILQRASIRRYEPRRLEPEKLEALLAAALRAPTTAMGHFYSMIVVSDPALKAQLYEVCDRQRAMQGSEFVVFCVDIRRTDAWARHLGVRRLLSGYTALLFGTIDMALAAQNLVIAAAGMGLGTCYIGKIGHKAAEICRLLSLPAGVLPVVGLTIGYPAESPQPRTRIPLRFMVHRDRYRDMTPDDIDEALLALAGCEGGDPAELRSRAAEAASFFAGIIEGSWWQPGERSLRKALVSQGMAPDGAAAPRAGEAGEEGEGRR
ncbi:MAG: nitroreductase family protein [Acetobacteraceae bacterium]|nr:nitroreductase family protein [Acetobacteraceae bacterium]